MTAAFWLALYRGAWILALPCIRLLEAIRVLPRNWRVTERLDSSSPWLPGDRPLWLHCASLGEAKGLWALAGALPPDQPLLLTAATAAGADYLARACAGSGAARRARLAPLDHPRLLESFLARGCIRGLCAYEVELWPNALMACAWLGLPAALAGGRLSLQGLRAYGRFGGAASRLLDGLAWIDAQSGKDRDRFGLVTDAPAHVGGDYKALAYAPGAPGAPGRDGGRAGFAFVSLHLPELKRLRPALPALLERHEVLIFPRRAAEMEAFAAILEPMGFARAGRGIGARHLLVDSFGKVGEYLPRCHTAFVGGSLIPRGCHNLWEPLAAGCRILFGPDYRHQRVLAELLLARGLAQAIDTPADLAGLSPAPVGQAAACLKLARELREGLEAARDACRERIIATFYAAPAPAGRQAGLAVPAGGEGMER